jgi:uncharacterized protein with von Willebrand factor type A (vWA) domain
MTGSLLPNIVLFGRVLRRYDFPVTTQLVMDFTNAMNHISMGRRADVYFTARSLFVQRREDIERFDAAFDVFWHAREGRERLDLRVPMQAQNRRRTQGTASGRDQQVQSTMGPLAVAQSDGAAGSEAPWALGFSDRERLRHTDFAHLTPDELAKLQSLIGRSARLAWRKRSHRLAAGRGPEIDLRRTLRNSLRHGGEWLDWAPRRRLNKARPLVVLADISGSMASYTRLVLMFVHGLARGSGAPLEAFVFGTQLSRITRSLIRLPIDQALDRVARQVEDWSGGTRIGAALREFNLDWTRRVLSGGAVVLLISDGWDRGDPGQLAEEAARLQRRAHRLVWLNPLLGTPGYRPLTRGVRAALPYVDDFLPAHNLASLEALGSNLAALIRRSPAGTAAFPTWQTRGG